MIVDNILYLATANTNAGAALRLMRALGAIKNGCGVSILVLAHTPKRAIAKPLSGNDLAGSKMLANFADNLFAFGQSTLDKELRYIKHIKHRNSASTYDSSNVIVCRIEKTTGAQSLTGAQASPLAGTESDSESVPSSPADKKVSANHLPPTANCFLGFRFIDFDRERHHTTRSYDNTNADRQNLISAARARGKCISYTAESAPFLPRFCPT